MTFFLRCLGIYFLGCPPALLYFLLGRAPVLSVRNWFWPVIFLWPLLIFWPVCAGAKRFSKSRA
jgi:hypothetical protein